MKVKLGSYTTKYVGTAQAEETFCENEHVTTGSQITLWDTWCQYSVRPWEQKLQIIWQAISYIDGSLGLVTFASNLGYI